MDTPEDFQKAHPFAPTGWEPQQDSNAPQKSFEEQNPFAPTGWAPKSPETAPLDPIQRAVNKYLESQKKVETPLQQFQTPSGYQNMDIILARLNRVEQMIDGATIGATCNATTSTITVTLTWGG